MRMNQQLEGHTTMYERLARFEEDIQSRLTGARARLPTRAPRPGADPAGSRAHLLREVTGSPRSHDDY